MRRFCMVAEERAMVKCVKAYETYGEQEESWDDVFAVNLIPRAPDDVMCPL